MESANIIQEDIPEQIVLNPATPYVEKFVAHTNPLNVLKGDSLMTPIEKLQNESGTYQAEKGLNFALSAEGKLESVDSTEGSHLVVDWAQGLEINKLALGSVVLAPSDINMRDAVEVRYQTQQPLLLQKEGSVVGVLGDHDFYHALLGKHFSSNDS